MNTEVTVGERQVENRTPTIARPMIASPWSSPLRQLLFLHVVQFCLVAMVLYFSLHLHRKNLSVPFDFWGDTMQILANVTAIIRTGWYWSNPLLSAPFSFPIIAFPSNNSVDYAIVWLIARFSSNPGLILNLSWLLFVFLTSATAFYCIRQLGVNTTVAMLCGTIYGLLPFTFYRSTPHLQLSFYLVPFACAAAVSIASDENLSPRFGAVVLIACGVLGFNYVYNAFFAVIAISAALAIAVLRGYGNDRRRFALVAIALVGVATIVNLAPSLQYWHTRGKPFDEYKSVGEAEVYGLRIRHLIGPIPARAGVWRVWAEKEASAHFPGNDYTTDRLGIVPSIGFLVLMVAIFRPHWLDSARYRKLQAAADLNLVLVLVATIGGFGSLFNLFVSPAIRCYDRIVVYIGFLSVFALAVLVSRVLEYHPRRIARYALLIPLLVFALYDQTRAAVHLLVRYSLDAALADSTADTVRQLETQICSRCMVFELPETPYPADPWHNQMPTYEHGRPHIYSNTLRWSWPAFAEERRYWGASLHPNDPERFVRELAVAGFEVIWLDRSGYAHPSESPESGLRQFFGPPLVVSKDGRIAVFDLRHFAEQAKNMSAAERESALHPTYLSWGPGFDVEETGFEHQPFRWSKERSRVTIVNPANRKRHVTFQAGLQAPAAESQELLIRAGDGVLSERIGSKTKDIFIPLELGPHQSIEIIFEFHGKQVDAPGDPRQLYFAVIKPSTLDRPQ